MNSTDTLRVVIADDEPRMRDYLWGSLQRMSHQVVSGARTGRELVEQCRELQPDLVICDIKMPDMDGIDAADEICRVQPVPVIIVSAFHDEVLIRRACRKNIMAYLVKPIKETDLKPAITIALERFREFSMLRSEAMNLKQALEDRKTIERAKGILMKRTGLDEPEAFRRLQKFASSKSQPLIDIARMVITAEEAVGKPEL